MQVCHVGDALADDVVVPGGFAGLVVDLFADGQVLPVLRQVLHITVLCSVKHIRLHCCIPHVS